MEAQGGERRPDSRRPSSWTARILAPLALALVAIAVVAVVSASLDSSDEPRERERSESTGCQPDAEQAVEDGYYVIEPGEDLSIVADRTCIPVERLIDLNQNLDPQAIQPASCVDLRVDGCKALAEG